MGTVTEELTVAELATLAKFASPDSLLAKLLRIYHAQTELIADARAEVERLDDSDVSRDDAASLVIGRFDDILNTKEDMPPGFVAALTDALREYGEEPAPEPSAELTAERAHRNYAERRLAHWVEKTESAEARLAAVRSLVALWRAQADDYENQAEAQDLAPMGPTCSVAVKMCAAELEDELKPRSDTKD